VEYVGPDTAFTGPTQEQALPKQHDTSHLDRLGVEPWKVDEWRKQAMAADRARGNTGPFRVRETGGAGKGGFSPSAQVPGVAGLSTQEYEEAYNQQSPGVQRLMEERRAKLMQDAAQATAIDQAQAQTGGQQAEAQLMRARAEALGREARTLPEQIREQEDARQQIMGLVQAHPAARAEADILFKGWLDENPGAPPEVQEQQRQFFNFTVAQKYFSGVLQQLQASDPSWSLGYARAVGLPAGGGEY
jgi:cell division septum initiation protein DivIVA